jgi:hypothetical protein
MLNAFDTVPKEARAEHRRAYREYLGQRDGELDFANRKLSRRELSMGRFETATQKRALDATLFQEQYDHFDRKRETTPEMLLLLALVKLNGAEAYGVNYTFDDNLERALAVDQDDTELFLLTEEHYHTRILLSAALEYGLNVRETFRPPLNLRMLIGTIASSPTALARPMTLASELYGVTLFVSLLERAGEVLKHTPLLRDSVEERILEILIDEIGHVTFNRLELGAWGLFQARAILPLVARGLSNFCPELNAVGVDTSGNLEPLRRLPSAVRKGAFVV